MTPLLIFLTLPILFHNVRKRLPFVCPVLVHYTMPNHAIGGTTAAPREVHDGAPPRAQVAGFSARGGCGLLPRLPPAACAPGVPLGVHGGV